MVRYSVFKMPTVETYTGFDDDDDDDDDEVDDIDVLAFVEGR